MPTVAMISLGCSRNQVDSETMLGVLKEDGFRIVDAEDHPQFLILNTCAFVNKAREESIDHILEAAALKRSGKVKYLVVCGCLPQLYREKLAREMPEVDLALGTSDFPKISDHIKALASPGRRRTPLRGGSAPHRTFVSASRDYLYDESSPRQLLSPRHYAYVKISEGCPNFCSYCIIPRLRGPFRSRSLESVVSEVERLSKHRALKELIIVGQDTTSFGLDRYGKTMLPYGEAPPALRAGSAPPFGEAPPALRAGSAPPSGEAPPALRAGSALPDLLRAVCRLKSGVRWIRLLYTHPGHYTDELISVIRNEDKICKYLDLPIQHISDRILKKMGRPTTRRHITGLIEKLRRRIPRLVLRTSIIAGFPTETDRDFRELLEFVKETRFERLGAFAYSREAGTKAAKLKGQIPEKVRAERMDELMRLQQRISRDLNASYIGKTVDVLLDERAEGGKERYMGRMEGDAPEIDGGIWVAGRSLAPGEFYKVRITGAMEYDLEGKAL